MIEHIHIRLEQWAEWATRREAGGLGFPRQALFSRLSASSGIPARVYGFDEAALQVEAAVVELRRVHAALSDAVFEFYRKTGSAEFKARSLGVSRDTLYARVHRAHLFIAQEMEHQNRPRVNDLAAV